MGFERKDLRPPTAAQWVPLPVGEGGPAKPGRASGLRGDTPSSSASRHLLPQGEKADPPTPLAFLAQR